jgi:hypothetical protein
MKRKKIPFDFAIENLHILEPFVRPMFGAHAVYVGPKLVLILRDKEDEDSGVWLGTSKEHHASLKKEFPGMRSIAIFGPGVSGWQVLPKDAEDFESSVNHACTLILRGDPRIGRVPKAKIRKKK